MLLRGIAQAIKALTAALAPKARAMRDGKLEQIESSGLVPGDVILMAIGNIVPADVKLLGEVGDDVPMQVPPSPPSPSSVATPTCAPATCIFTLDGRLARLSPPLC